MHILHQYVSWYNTTANKNDIQQDAKDIVQIKDSVQHEDILIAQATTSLTLIIVYFIMS